MPGPLADTFSALYNVSGDTVQLMLNWGPIWYLPLAIPVAYWLDQRSGLKWSTMLFLVLVVLGVVLRCLARDNSTLSIVLLHIGFSLNAIAGPCAMGAVSRLAEDWFPATERGLATAVAAQANIFGTAIAFLVGPYVVDEDTMAKLQLYNYIGLGFCATTLVASLVYFPVQPPSPPSLSAASQSHGSSAFTPAKLWAALWDMCRNKDFIILCLAYGITCGMASGWNSTLAINLQALNYGQDQAGWIGFATVIAGNIGGILLGRLVDRFRHHKLVISIMLTGSVLSLAWFSLLVQKVFPDAWTMGNAGFIQIFVSATLAGFFINSSVPVYFELSIEATYPLPEGSVVMVMTILNNASTLVLLLVPLSNAAAAFNYIFTAACGVITLIVILFYTEGSRRYRVDAGKEAIGDDDDDQHAKVHHDAAVRLLQGDGLSMQAYDA